MSDTLLSIDKLRKHYGDSPILKGVSLSLARGEVLALLGPSGSGKTTLLRAVAGLDRPDDGSIRLADTVVFDAARGIEIPAERRGLGLVFQSYAVWPHRDVFDNVAYGLRLRRVGADEIGRRVDAILARLGLAGLARRFPHQLSGGQQQRVALARALVYNPALILLDEPLSNLDAKLREEARVWLRELIVRERLSALYVTHDQAEAMAVADRVILLNGGVIEQEGRPQQIYDEPASAFAAEFMGSNNRLSGTLVAADGRRGWLEIAGERLEGALRAPAAPGDAVTALIRIERSRLADGPGGNRLEMTVLASLYLGGRWEHLLARDGLEIRHQGAARLPAGSSAWIELAAPDLWLFPAGR